jgi:hypothetical protein
VKLAMSVNCRAWWQAATNCSAPVAAASASELPICGAQTDTPEGGCSSCECVRTQRYESSWVHRRRQCKRQGSVG